MEWFGLEELHKIQELFPWECCTLGSSEKREATYIYPLLMSQVTSNPTLPLEHNYFLEVYKIIGFVKIKAFSRLSPWSDSHQFHLSHKHFLPNTVILSAVCKIALWLYFFYSPRPMNYAEEQTLYFTFFFWSLFDGIRVYQAHNHIPVLHPIEKQQ